MEREDYCGTTLKMALVFETYTNSSTPSMRLSSPQLPLL